MGVSILHFLSACEFCQERGWAVAWNLSSGCMARELFIQEHTLHMMFMLWPLYSHFGQGHPAIICIPSLLSQASITSYHLRISLVIKGTH